MINLYLVGNYGQEWEVGHIQTKTPYRIGTGEEIHANIGVKIGFRSVNVTLKADTHENRVLRKEIIDYNERFEWTWDQGRFGFGPYGIFFIQMFLCFKLFLLIKRRETRQVSTRLKLILVSG